MTTPTGWLCPSCGKAVDREPPVPSASPWAIGAVYAAAAAAEWDARKATFPEPDPTWPPCKVTVRHA